MASVRPRHGGHEVVLKDGPVMESKPRGCRSSKVEEGGADPQSVDWHPRFVGAGHCASEARHPENMHYRGAR